MNGNISSMKEPLAYTAVGTALVNEVSGNKIVTVETLENLIFLGMTWGVWFKLVLGLSLVLLVVERIWSIRLKHVQIQKETKAVKGVGKEEQ